MEQLDINQIWEKVFNIVKTKTSSLVGLNVHMKDAEPVSVNNTTFTISVPLSLNKNMILLRYKDDIEAALEQVTSQKLNLNITIKGEEEKKEEQEEVQESEQASTNRLNPRYTFENFVIGPSNAYAAAAALSATKNPGNIYNPLFLYGNSGLGKTHLMYAIGNRIQKYNPDFNIIYVTSEEFTNEFITSVRDAKGDEFRKKYRSVDVLLVDDVQFLKQKEATQEEFFHTFNELYSMNKQIVITSDRSPFELVTLEERLRNRFGQGLTIDITIPNYETRVAILQKKALQHNANIDTDVLGLIAERIKSNVRELEGILIKLISISEISDQKIDLELAEYVLKSYLPKSSVSKITPDKIMEKVSLFYNITIEDLIGKQRTSNVALPRQIAMYLCHKLTDLNFSGIGREFDGKDRTTVMHNVRKIESEIETREDLKSDINYIIKDLQSM